MSERVYSMDTNESGPSSSTIASVSNSNSPSDLFKLDVDCLEELCEWLSLQDLRALRQTCRRLKQVVNYYIHMSYPLGFGVFKLRDDSYKYLYSFDDSLTKLYKTIKIDLKTPLKTNMVRGLKHILSKVENIVIKSLNVNSLYDDFLRFCHNLKSLRISERYYWDLNKIKKDKKWLLQQYPKLEHFGFIASDLSLDGLNINQLLQKFLNRNPNIRKLAISSNVLDDWMINSDLNFDILEIEIEDYEMENDMDHFINLLNILHEKGFYKRLHLYGFQGNEQHVAKLRSLEMFYIDNSNRGDDDELVEVDIVLPILSQLKIFYAYHPRNIVFNVESLVNIEILHFTFASFKEISPFLRQLTKLKKIKISILTRQHVDKGVCLLALNEERGKCSRASKVTIYVEKCFYLNTKLANMQTKFDLIELKPAETHIWEHERNHFAFVPNILC